MPRRHVAAVTLLLTAIGTLVVAEAASKPSVTSTAPTVAYHGTPVTKKP